MVMRHMTIGREGVRLGRLILVLSGRVVGLSCLLIVGLVFGVSGLGLGYYLAASRDLPALDDVVNYSPPAVSTLYADDGTKIAEFYDEKRYIIPLDSLPGHVISAVLAAEDSRFFSHSGIDCYAVARAVVRNLQAGYYAQGASTITQQLVRSLLLTREKRLMRKIREAILAYRLEQRLSKKEILQIYLNHIYFGRGAYGIEAAAGVYFGKSAPELTISEAALLAGMVANPTRYSNPMNPALPQRRGRTVLNRMLDNGFITGSEYKAALNSRVMVHTDGRRSPVKAPYFVDAVRRYLEATYGANELHRGA